MASSNISGDCKRHGLNFVLILVGPSPLSEISFSSVGRRGVDLASGVTDGAGVGNSDLLGGCLPIIGDAITSGESLNRTVFFPVTPEYCV